MHTHAPLLAFDFLDPWGWIAKRRLETALKRAQLNERIDFHPCRSAIAKNSEGLTYREIQERRYGTEAVVHQSLVTEELRKLGIEVALEKISTVPNTFPALAAVLWLQRRGQDANLFVDRVYQALYSNGRNVGDFVVLQELAQLDDTTLESIRDYSQSEEFFHAAKQNELQVERWAGRLLPSMRINGSVIFGAQVPEVLLPVLT